MIRLAVRCRPEQAELVLAELVELVPGGVEERRGTGYVEYAIYGAPGELPELPDLRAAAGDGLVEVETSELADDWADRWRDFHRPVAVGGGRLVIRPSWVEEGAADAEVEIVIDPGRAFGTGAHATTRGCLELLLGLADRGAGAGPLADWGTGSGVLSIAAARLGWAPVTACDQDRAAVAVAAANARANGVAVTTRAVDLRDQPPPAASTVTANLTVPLLVALAGRIAAGDVATPDRLVAGGLPAAERDRVADAYAAAGLAATEVLVDGDWAALLLEPPVRPHR